jgi:arylsulfatase A-like enzyme
MTRKRMETADDEFLSASLDFIDRANKAGKPFFIWHNSTRMHVWTRLSPKWQGKTGYGLYADGMADHDSQVGQLLDKLDKLGIADNTIVVYTTDNGAELMSWPDGGTIPFKGEKGTTWEGGFRVPAMVRWPGVVKPGTVINDIFSMEDWIPTLMAGVGEPDIKEKLLKGHKANGKKFKVHLDGYNQMDLLAGKGPGARNEIFYFDAGGNLNALRYKDWKVHFTYIEGDLTEAYRKSPSWPTVFNLRMSPFERPYFESRMYLRWMADQMWMFVPAQQAVAKFLASFKKFPQRQPVASLSVQKVLEQMQKQSPHGK